MKSNNILFLLLLFLFLYLFNIKIINCQLTKIGGTTNLINVFPSDDNLSYKTYLSDSDVCQFQFNYFANYRGGSGNVNEILQFNPKPSPINVVKSSNNQTYFIKNVFLSTPTHITVNLTNDIWVQYKLDFECIYFNNIIDSLNFTILNDRAQYSALMFYSLFKIDGLNETFDLILVPDKNAYFYQIGNDFTYIIYWSTQYVYNQLLNDNYYLNTSFILGNKNITLSTKSYYFDGIASLQSPKSYYPPNLNNNSIYNEFGLGNSLLVSINTDYSEIRPFTFIGKHDDLDNCLSLPIKGKLGNMTFMDYPDTDLSDGGSIMIYDNSKLTVLNPTINEYTIPASSLMKSLLSIMNNSTMFSVSTKFNITSTQPFPLINFNFRNGGFDFEFPYGCDYGNLLEFNHKSNYGFVPMTMNNNPSFTISYGSGIASSSIISLTKDLTLVSQPILKSYQIIKIDPFNILIKVSVTSEFGITQIIAGFQLKKYGLEKLVKGTNKDGDYEIILDSFDNINLLFIDIYDNQLSIIEGETVIFNNTTNLPTLYKSNLNTKLLKYNDIKSISFLYNDLILDSNKNVSGQGGYNIMYLKLDESVPIDISMKLILFDPISYKKSLTKVYSLEFLNSKVLDEGFPIIYNEASQLFICKFKIPLNNIYNEIPYAIATRSNSAFGILTGYYTLLYSNDNLTKLKVTQSYLDNQGPIFSEISNTDGLVFASVGSINWTLTITDDYNGFKSGYIVVKGLTDGSTYSFNFTTNHLISGNKFKGTYVITIHILSPCISQTFQITHVTLIDTQNIISVFNLYPTIVNNYQSDPIINPFINFLNDLNITKITIKSTNIPLSPFVKSVIKSFTTSKSIVDVGSNDRDITFTFSVQSNSNGFKDGQFPIVYLTTSNMNIWKCLVDETSSIQVTTNFLYTYTITTTLPLGFGYPGDLLVSVYGFIGNDGYVSGFSAYDLLYESSVLNSTIQTTYSTSDPIITGVGEIFSNTGGTLLIYGRSFHSNSIVLIDYKEGNGFQQTLTTEAVYGSSSLLVSGIKNNLVISPIDIKLQYTVGTDVQTSNVFNVYPTYFPISDPNIQPPTIAPTSSPTSTPLITNAPQKCQGNPECGGVDHGYCSSKGCVCFSPWIGLACNSKVIIIPPPIVNPNEPSFNLSTTTNTNNQTNSQQDNLLIAIISIVALRELDFNNNILNTYYLNKWNHTPLSANKNLYFNNEINVLNKEDGTFKQCNITVTTEWFEQLTNITWANQELVMNPSTLKYNINITQYSFSSNLNSLQLIFKTKASKDQNSGVSGDCSNNQFGDTVNDNSNFVQLSINDLSLYGRFVKRSIIDDKFISIENEKLNNFAIDQGTVDGNNEKDENTYYSSSSYISIKIPNYSELVQLDPDFSILVGGGSTNDDDQSSLICKKNNNKLSTGAIIGIVVGCVGASIIIIAIILIFKKYKYQIRNIKVLKLRKLNK